MLNDETLEDEVRGWLHELADHLVPTADLTAQVLARHARRRRRSRMAAVAGAVAIAAAIALPALLTGAGVSAGPQMRLASFRLRLPAHARILAPDAHVCLPAVVMYPSTQVPNGGPANPAEPAITSAVTADGGCLSVFLTAPYTPGGNEVPSPFIDVQSEKPVRVSSYAGVLGPFTWIGRDMSYQGFQIPNGTQQSVLALHVPVAGGQDELLVFAAEHIAPQALLSIVRSGLTAGQTPS